MNLMRIWSLGMGGFLGATLRYSIAINFPLSAFPWATLFVNGLGCFLIGILYQNRNRMSSFWCDFSMVGFCGSLTTVSLFQLELFHALSTHEYILAFNYLATSLLLTLIPLIFLIVILKRNGDGECKI